MCLCGRGEGVRGVDFTSSCWFSLNNSKAVKGVTLLFAAFSNILLETSVPNLVSLTHPSLQILGKSQTGVFPTSSFLVNHL